MTTKYLLPCSCGEETPVEPRQAGELIRCTCGASVEVPTMLEMRGLKRVEPEPTPSQAAAPWGIRQRLVLLGSVIMLAVLVLAIVLCWSRPVSPRAGRGPAVIRQQMRDIAPLPSWRAWQALRAAGLDPDNEAEKEAYQESLFRWWLGMGVVLIIGAVGIGLTVVPLFTRPRPGGN